MDHLLLAIAALACPVGMGAMMFTMMRRSHGTDMVRREEMTRLRAEIDGLKTERRTTSEVSGFITGLDAALLTRPAKKRLGRE